MLFLGFTIATIITLHGNGLLFINREKEKIKAEIYKDIKELEEKIKELKKGV